MYKENKDSGVKFVGHIPNDWSTIKTKYLFNITRGRVIAKTELDDKYKYPVYSSQTKNDGVLGYIESYDFQGDKLTWTTDGANAGTVSLRTGKYSCTNVCGVLDLKNNENNLSYLKYTLESLAIYHKRPDTNGYKIMSNEMAEIAIPLPDLDTQKQISSFLDQKTEEIDNVIYKTELSINEYKNYKQSLITQTVTKGMNSTAAMKDSKIEWIEQIPEKWKVRKMKHVGRFSSSGIDKFTKENENIIKIVNYVDVYNNVTKKLFNKDDYMKVSASDNKIREHILLKGDALFTPSSETVDEIGYSAIVEEDLINTAYSYHLLRYRANNLIDHNYKKYIFYNAFLLNQFSLKARGTTRKTLNRIDFDESVLLIPTIYEQKEISEYLDDRTAQIDKIIEGKVKLLVEMERYKKSLIYETVTGKREVA